MSETHDAKPALPLPADDELSPEILATLKKLPPLNVFRMATNAPASFQPFVDLALSILAFSEFDKLKREIAVLRVAHLTDSHYEWTQHVRVATTLGMDAETIEKLRCDGPVTTLGEEGNLLCRVADEITRDIRLSDDALAQIMARYGTRQAMELIVCCAYFNMLSRILESTRVELEPDSPL
jgi:alkylhydroperoxidase family enzyme